MNGRRRPLRTACALATALVPLTWGALGGQEHPHGEAHEAMEGHHGGPAIEFLTTPRAREAGFPFSPAVRVGHLLFLSGQVGTRPGEGLVSGGIEAETRQVMENIKATVERYGSSMDRIVKCTVFLADIAEWGTFNRVYRTFFEGNFPARSALAASGLALDARVEVECIAVAGGGGMDGD